MILCSLLLVTLPSLTTAAVRSYEEAVAVAPGVVASNIHTPPCFRYHRDECHRYSQASYNQFSGHADEQKDPDNPRGYVGFNRRSILRSLRSRPRIYSLPTQHEWTAAGLPIRVRRVIAPVVLERTVIIKDRSSWQGPFILAARIPHPLEAPSIQQWPTLCNVDGSLDLLFLNFGRYFVANPGVDTIAIEVPLYPSALVGLDYQLLNVTGGVNRVKYAVVAHRSSFSWSRARDLAAQQQCFFAEHCLTQPRRNCFRSNLKPEVIIAHSPSTAVIPTVVAQTIIAQAAAAAAIQLALGAVPPPAVSASAGN